MYLKQTVLLEYIYLLTSIRVYSISKFYTLHYTSTNNNNYGLVSVLLLVWLCNILNFSNTVISKNLRYHHKCDPA